MSKASEYAAITSDPPACLCGQLSMVVQADGNIRMAMLNEGGDAEMADIEFCAADVPRLIKWLRETFED